MPRKYTCPRCSRTFTTSQAEFEHFKREHVGKMSREGFEYAISVGISPEKLLRFCRENEIELAFDLEEWMREYKMGQVTLEAFV
jgi:hypothetical protein